MLEQKDTYTLQELFEQLPVTLVELGERAGISDVTLARIRDGQSARRSTVNRMLNTMSKVYEQPLSIRNVTGINMMRNYRLEKKEARQAEKDQSSAA
jgi:predicted transcriptional regulator